MSAASDVELVEAFLERKQDSAYVELVRRHQIPVFRKLAVELADPDDAEAVCETVFVIASQRLGEWTRETDFRDWLLEVAREVAESRRGQPPDPESPRLVDPAIYFKHSVHQALYTLEPEQRSLLLAVDLEGQSVEEVARTRGLPAERVTEFLDIARERFTQALASPAEASAPSVETAPPRIEPGEIIDNRYRLEAQIGQGGMATVFRAEHLAIKRKVALKTLRPTRQTEAMLRERFTREAEVLGKLAHPNFVDVSDFGESSRGLAYLVMELLNGHPLSAEVRKGPVAPARALAIVREVCNGLSFAHGLGIIHRDIKPDNIVVLEGERREGFAKILDLGVAATDEEAASGDKTLYGTPAYMAPEQIVGGRIDGRVDLYAVGVMLFELLTGELPFRGSSLEFVLAQHLTTPPPKLSDLGVELPEQAALQHLLDRCLAKDPAARVGSAQKLIEELNPVLARLEATAVPGAVFVAESSKTGSTERVTAPALSRPRSQAPVWLILAFALALGLLYWSLR